jgi:hypothetical protein
MQEAAALKVVREFRAVLARSRKAYEDMLPNSPTGPAIWYSLSLTRMAAPAAYREVENEINDSIHAVELIANEIDPKLANAIRARVDKAWPYIACDAACNELVRVLSGRVKVGRILARNGPLEGAGFHPWVWQAAEELWRGGHHPEAVRAAASRILDDELPSKLGVPKGTSSMGEVFSKNPPTENSPRLRFRVFQPGTEDWVNAHEGANLFGMGCEKARAIVKCCGRTMAVRLRRARSLCSRLRCRSSSSLAICRR